MGMGFHGGFGNTKGAEKVKKSAPKQHISKENLLITYLNESNIKFCEEDIAFITQDKTGQVVWLEKGNAQAGLTHILDGNGKSKGHAQDFESAFGIKKSKIAAYLKKVITFGEVIKNELITLPNGKTGYTREYAYEENYIIISGIGTNGFIISAYPKRKGKK